MSGNSNEPGSALSRSFRLVGRARTRHGIAAIACAALALSVVSIVPVASFPRVGFAEAPALRCQGALQQGGGVVCQSPPGSQVQLGQARTRANDEGWLVLGFDRDAPKVEIAKVVLPDGRRFEQRFEIAQRSFDVSRIDGLPPEQVDRYTPEQLRRIEASSRRKSLGDESRAPISGFVDGFALPLRGRRSSPFGAQRILNGVPKRPHYGVDLAAPLGTPIVAPADGIVTLADDDLYFEGAMIVVDHGQGFLSKYLHVSRIDVAEGQRVKRGQRIGAVGSRGRSTGPHLCWRLKWRDRNLDPELWLSASMFVESPAVAD